MHLKKIAEILDAEILFEPPESQLEITSACGADLMSDVMAFSKDNTLLLTGLIHPQVIRTAEMLDIKVVAFVRGKMPSEQVMELAKEKGIAVLATKEPMFVACGRLYNAGINGRGAGC